MTSAAVREKSEVTDLHETGWQDMQKETADELDRFNRHELLSVVIG
jgi:hypothetical protein